jgi:hypothetical protein
MSTDFRITSLARAAAISMALVIPAVAGLSPAARADDEYGTNRGPSILQSAQSVHAANPAETPLAVATAQARVAASPVATTAQHAPVAGLRDLVGQGGEQDELARETYHPGSGTDW